MPLAHNARILICFLIAAWAMTGCKGKNNAASDAHLLRIGSHIVMEKDFEASFERAKSGYPPNLKSDLRAYQNARWRLLNQLAEEGVILERARALEITVSASELDAAVSNLKADFPDEQFEQTFLENAVAFDEWKQGLARKILLEKVIVRELGEPIKLTPGPSSPILTDAKTKAPTPPSDNSVSDNSGLFETSTLETWEARYLDWIHRLQQDYPIEINWELWKKIASR